MELLDFGKLSMRFSLKQNVSGGWVHKTANILDKMPKSIQSKAKSNIHEMYMAETEEVALKAYDHFVSVYQDKYPKAVACLTKDKDDLFNFYSFPGNSLGPYSDYESD